MKLHLPKKLRAALLAVVTAAVAAPATTLAADGAAYDYTYFQHATQVHANLGENSFEYYTNEGEGGTSRKNYDFRDPLKDDPDENMFNARKNDWTLTVDVYNFLPMKDLEDEKTLAAILFGNGRVTVNETTNSLEMQEANSFAVVLDRFGSVRLITAEEANSIDNDIALFKLDERWSEEDREDDVTVSLRITLSWDADGGLYDPDSTVDEVKRYGALTLQSAYLLSNDSSHAVIKEIESYYTGRVVFNNYKMEEDLFSITDPENNDPTASGGAFSGTGKGGTAAVTLLTPGADAAWCVTGDTSIKYLLEGRYLDKTTEGAPTPRKLKKSERVQFVGNNGTIWLTSGEYTYDNPTWATIDPTGRSSSAGIGFGAYAGATIKVTEQVVNSTVIGSNATINALGDGTVRFVVNTNDIETVDLPAVIAPPVDDEELEEAPAPEVGDDDVAGDDTNIPEDNTNLEGEEEDIYDGPDPDYNPAITAGTRNLVFNQLGAHTNVELEVIGSNDVAVILGAATIGNNDATNTTRITRLQQEADDEGNIPDGGAIRLVLYNGSKTQQTSYIGSVENKEGDLNIIGREVITTTDEYNNVISSEPVYSRLSAKDLIATGKVTVNGIVRASGQVSSGADMKVETGYLQANNLSSGGHLHVGSNADSDAILIVDGAANVAGSVEVYGQASAGDLTTAQGVVVHNTAFEDAVLEARSISGRYVTRELTVTNSIIVDEEEFEEMEVEEGAEITEDEDGIKITTTSIQNIHIGYNAAVAEDSGEASPLLSGGVSIGKDGISAGTIAGNTVINIASDCPVGVSATNMLGSELKIDNDVIMTNVRNSGGVAQFISNEGNGTISSAGKLSADTLVLPETYILSARELSVKEGLFTAKMNTTGETSAEDIAVNGNVILIGSIKADTLDISDDADVVAGAIETTGGAVLGNNISLSGTQVKGDISIGANASLTAISCEGVLETQDGATISDTVITNTYKSHGSTTLRDISVVDATFGGAQGDAFSASGVCDAMVFSGKMTTTENGTTLNVTDVRLDATNLTFTEAGEEYTLLEATEGNSYTLQQKADDMFIYVESYTLVDVTSDGSSISLSGYRAEETIKAELVEGSETRANALASLENALATDADTVVESLHDKLGDVRHTSLAARRELLDAISGASLTALADSQRTGIQDVQGSLRNRIIQMGGARDTVSAGIQAWAQADGSFSTVDAADDGFGYDYNTWGATVGANMDVTENFVLGLSFSASYGEIKSDGADQATGNNDACYVNFFARHQSNRWTQLLIFTVGSNDMDMERTVGAYDAKGSTSGSSVSGYYELGYTLGLDDEFTHVLQPIISASITSAKVDGYTEEGTIGNAALEYDAANLVYGTVGVGLRYQGVLYETAFERCAVLEARAQITQDFGDKTNEASVSMAKGEFNTVTGTDTTGTGYNLGVGLSLPIQMQTTFFADVDLSIRPDSTGARANVGLRYDF